MGRLVLFGLDGADLGVILPFVERGLLPHFAALLERGAHGPLRSTCPPMSPPAWTSFLTGKDPGKHGIFDFTARRPGSYDVEFVNARSRRAATMFRMMSDAGKRVCVLSVPMTYPPERLNGAMISGFDTPGVGGGLADASAFSPPELHREIQERFGGYVLGPEYGAPDELAPERMVQAALASIDRKMACATYLAGKEDWDCFMITIGETDGIPHRLWQFHDPSSPLADEQARAYHGEDPLLAVYRRIDAHLGALVASLGADVTLLVLSDHGHAGNGDRAVYLNRWLEAGGHLRFAGGGLRAGISRLLTFAKRMGTGNAIPVAYRQRLFRKTRLAGRVESWLRFSHLDWARTRAYSEETPYFPNIWINVAGREPRGTVRPGAEYDQLRDELVASLEAWRDPGSGEPVVKRAWKREELYRGPYLDRSPDLVVEWALDRGYSYLFRSSRRAGAAGLAIERLEGKARRQVKSGDHRDDGLLIAGGAGVARQGRIEGARIIDLAPTCLHLLGLEVPSDMDGVVLTSLLGEGGPPGPVRYREGDAGGASVDPGATPGASPGEGPAYTDEESEAIRARLRGLGYIE